MKKSMSSLNVKKKISVKALLFGLSILATAATCCDNRAFASFNRNNNGNEKILFATLATIANESLPDIADFGYYPKAKDEVQQSFSEHYQNIYNIHDEAHKNLGNIPPSKRDEAETVINNFGNNLRKEGQRYIDEINSFNDKVNGFNKEVRLQTSMHGGDYPSYDENYAALLYENLGNKSQLDRDLQLSLFGNESKYNQTAETINNGKKLSLKKKEEHLKNARKKLEEGNTKAQNEYDLKIAKEDQNFKENINELNEQASKYVDWDYENLAKDPHWNSFWDGHPFKHFLTK